MANWNLIKSSYSIVDPFGVRLKISEVSLYDSINFTEAEMLAWDNSHDLQEHDYFSVKSIGAYKVNDMFIDPLGDKWYRIVAQYPSETSKGKQKMTPAITILNAGDIQTALDRFKRATKDYVIDYEVVSIVLTPIVNVFPHRILTDDEIAERDIRRGKLKSVTADQVVDEFIDQSKRENTPKNKKPKGKPSPNDYDLDKDKLPFS